LEPTPYLHEPLGTKKAYKFPYRQPIIMTIQYVSGDIFLNKYNAEALAHGCNCKGAMGAGVAKGFRQHYPDMYEEYRKRCKTRPRQFNLGDSFLWKKQDKPHVFNLGTQEDYWHHRATYDAIEKVWKQ
jgi:O-acetyl-ADP-ribose deacetylase (regulator of RNase III)